MYVALSLSLPLSLYHINTLSHVCFIGLRSQTAGEICLLFQKNGFNFSAGRKLVKIALYNQIFWLFLHSRFSLK